MENIIILIDTAVSEASVALSSGNQILVSRISTDPKETSAFVQDAIKHLFEETGMHIRDCSAVAVTAGPGSYTGLRVGMASAKGICYALNKPLITLNTLEVMAATSIIRANSVAPALFIPMIDARRMEVFTAVYDQKLTSIVEPVAMILDANSFSSVLESHPCHFSGNGAAKFLSLVNHPNAIFSAVDTLLPAMGQIAHGKLISGNFANLALSEPLYLKEFHSS